MGRIQNLPSTLQRMLTGDDKIVITDVENNNATANVTVEMIGKYFSSTGVIDDLTLAWLRVNSRSSPGETTWRDNGVPGENNDIDLSDNTIIITVNKVTFGNINTQSLLEFFEEGAVRLGSDSAYGIFTLRDIVINSDNVDLLDLTFVAHTGVTNSGTIPRLVEPNMSVNEVYISITLLALAGEGGNGFIDVATGNSLDYDSVATLAEAVDNFVEDRFYEVEVDDTNTVVPVEYGGTGRDTLSATILELLASTTQQNARDAIGAQDGFRDIADGAIITWDSIADLLEATVNQVADRIYEVEIDDLVDGPLPVAHGGTSLTNLSAPVFGLLSSTTTKAAKTAIEADVTVDYERGTAQRLSDRFNTHGLNSGQTATIIRLTFTSVPERDSSGPFVLGSKLTFATPTATDAQIKAADISKSGKVIETAVVSALELDVEFDQTLLFDTGDFMFREVLTEGDIRLVQAGPGIDIDYTGGGTTIISTAILSEIAEQAPPAGTPETTITFVRTTT